MSDSKSTEEFLDAKLVVMPITVHTDDHASYVTLRDYPTMVTKLRQLLDQELERRVAEVLERIMESRNLHSPVTNGHIHVKSVDYEYWKITGQSLLGREATLTKQNTKEDK